MARGEALDRLCAREYADKKRPQPKPPSRPSSGIAGPAFWTSALARQASESGGDVAKTENLRITRRLFDRMNPPSSQVVDGNAGEPPRNRTSRTRRLRVVLSAFSEACVFARKIADH